MSSFWIGNTSFYTVLWLFSRKMCLGFKRFALSCEHHSMSAPEAKQRYENKDQRIKLLRNLLLTLSCLAFLFTVGFSLYKFFTDSDIDDGSGTDEFENINGYPSVYLASSSWEFLVRVGIISLLLDSIFSYFRGKKLLAVSPNLRAMAKIEPRLVLPVLFMTTFLMMNAILAIVSTLYLFATHFENPNEVIGLAVDSSRILCFTIIELIILWAHNIFFDQEVSRFEQELRAFEASRNGSVVDLPYFAEPVDGVETLLSAEDPTKSAHSDSIQFPGTSRPSSLCESDLPTRESRELHQSSKIVSHENHDISPSFLRSSSHSPYVRRDFADTRALIKPEASKRHSINAKDC